MHVHVFYTILLDYNWWTNNFVRTILLLGGFSLLFYVIIPGAIHVINKINEWTHDRRITKYNLEQNRRNLATRLAMQAKVPPVLYLRPFAIDGTKLSNNENRVNEVRYQGITFGKDLEPVKNTLIDINLERSLCDTSEQIGPFVAIGKPSNEELNFGAYRLYYPDEMWKARALELMQNAAMILVRIKENLTDGFNWEISHISTAFLNKTVFLIEIKDHHQYQNFRTKLKSMKLIFPSQPELDRGYFFVSFNEMRKPSISSRMDSNNVFIQCKEKADKRKKIFHL